MHAEDVPIASTQWRSTDVPSEGNIQLIQKLLNMKHILGDLRIFFSVLTVPFFQTKNQDQLKWQDPDSYTCSWCAIVVLLFFALDQATHFFFCVKS